MSRVRAITFDIGGTLDGPGIPWRPRLTALYRSHGVDDPDEALARAFFDADDRLHERHALAGLDLAATVRLQVADTLASLGRRSPELALAVADAFVKEARDEMRAARPVLERLSRRFRLGVVSNNYGNLRDVLRHEGLLDLFPVVIDSREVGFEKPDPRIFLAACAALAVPPGQVAHVGDSVPRDVEGARAAGLVPIWFAPSAVTEPAPEPGVTRVRSLAELEAALGGDGGANTPPTRHRTFAGILAAGHGTRFLAAGVRTPKALVTVSGRSLIRRTLDAFAEAGFERATVVVNDAVAPLVEQHLAEDRERPRSELHVKTTASTLETFATLLDLAEAASAERFVFTTVDAVSAPGELARFADEATRALEPLVLGVAGIEPGDESPLRVELDPAGLARLGSGPHATAGFYAGEVRTMAREARAALAAGLPSLRAFLTAQSALSRSRGILVGRSVDVDTPHDVVQAERALQGWGRVRDGGSDRR